MKGIYDGTYPLCGGRLSLENPNTDEHCCDTCGYWSDNEGVHWNDDFDKEE